MSAADDTPRVLIADDQPDVLESLRLLRNKRQENPPKKHGNIPL